MSIASFSLASMTARRAGPRLSRLALMSVVTVAALATAPLAAHVLQVRGGAWPDRRLARGAYGARDVLTLVALLLLGYPVAFTLAGVGLLFALIGIAFDLFRPDFLNALPERVLDVMNSKVLIAIPFFTFMGMVLERSGLAEDLLHTMGRLFGPIRGGLGYSVIFVGMLLAAMTGVVAASVISMGLISLPIMLRYGYDRPLAAGVIAASGTLAQVIPPGIVLIVLADQLNVSVIDIFWAALRPASAVRPLYALYILATPILRRAVPPCLRRAASHNHARCGASLCCRRSLSSSWCWARSSSASRPRPREARWGPAARSSSPSSRAGSTQLSS